MVSKSANGCTDNDIAIVGMALKVPGAQSVGAFWDNLANGIESIDRLDADALRQAGERADRMADPNYVPAAARLQGFDQFDAEFFGFGPKDAAILDPQHRKFLEVAYEAMEQSGHLPVHGTRDIGVFAGCGMGSYFYFNICSNPDLVDEAGMFLLRHTGNDKDFMATRVSHVFDLKGPSIGLQTACSTSLVAVHYACQALREGQCDMALAGGSTIELPQGRGYLYKGNEILSPDGHCHAFDHRAQGTVFGSGAGVVALRRLSDAIADGDHIWAVIKGTAVNNDGAAKAGYLAPSVDGQATAVAQALDNANVSANSIGYVECHGTGTYLGDPIEVAALTEAYRQTTDRSGFCKIGSVKTNIGHLDTAAGVASLVKTSLALHHKAIPPSLGYDAPNPAIDFDTSPFRVADQLADWPAGDGPRRAGVNSLGVGGTNAHAILEEAPAREASEEADWPFHVLCLSAKGKTALDGNAKALAAHLRANSDQPLADIAFTLKSARGDFDDRRVLVAETHDEAIALLEEGDARRVFTHKHLADPDVVFMFPGGGAQYTGMARDLYETEPVFAEWMDRGLGHLQAQLDYDIRALWLPEPEARDAAEERLKQPSVQLPLIMITEYALAQLWISWGVNPTALIGHSMGENTAAALAGVMSFENCIDLVLLRGRLFDGVAPGGMLSVSLPEAELRALIGDDLDIASVNAPDLCAVSGPQDRLDQLQANLAAKEIDAQRVNIDIAAHSRMLDPILPEFRAFLAGLDLQAPKIPFISNRTGDWITPEQATDPDYWVGQLRNCVQFGQGVSKLAETPDRVFFEVGPGRALTTLAQMNAAVEANQVLSALRHPEDDIADDKFLLGVIGRFWAVGVEADWTQIWGEARRNRVVLPSYAFQTSRHFIEPGKAQADDTPDLSRASDLADWGYRPIWQPRYANCDAEGLAALGADNPLTWLVFADDTGLADILADRLRGAGHKVAMVRPGDSFAKTGDDEYRLAPEQGADGYAALMQALLAEGRMPDRIVHGWLVTGSETFRPGSDFFTRNIEHGVHSLLYLTQALEGVDRPDQMHLIILTSGAAQVGAEALPHPEKAAIAGPAGTIPKEIPGLTVATLDITPPTAPKRRAKRAPVTQGPALVDQVLEDLLADPANTVAALRDQRRYEQLWKPAPLPVADKAAFRDGGTYLITGGLGGIGLSIARDLAQTHQANLVLVSRSPLPPRGEWNAVLTAHGAPQGLRRRIEAIREIEALGGRVQIAQADICDIDQMRRAAQAARIEYGPVNGVIHAAGVIDDAPLLGKTAQDLETIFAPKLHGLRVLDQLFADGDLDLMVLCSSTSTITRPEGQVDYIAANEFLNAYARSRQGGKTRVLSVNWGVWNTVGMAADLIADRQAEGAAPNWSDTGLPLLAQAARGGRGRLQLDAANDWIVNEHRMADGTAVLPGTGYVELALQSHLAAGGALPVEVSDLMFLRPLDVDPAQPKAVETRLARGSEGMRFETRSACQVNGRDGLVLNAQAAIGPAPEAPAPLDLVALADRCAAPSAHMADTGFTSPQEAHLAFGPRWRVVTQAHIGAGEGFARLTLPQAHRDDLGGGMVLHPALLDLATGWAMELIDGYAPDHLWVPVYYGRIRAYRPMPADIFSWVRLHADADGAAGAAGFDVVICDTDGAVVAEITDFQMQRLNGQAALGGTQVTEVDDVLFEDAPVARGLSDAEKQMQRMVALGITPQEGVDALRRALARPEAQIALSPLPLDHLIALAQPQQAPDSAQSFERPELASDYAAPTTGTETQLAALWEKLLGVDRIGINDSFFDLGGHSLLAVRLFAAVKRAFGIQLPISVLFEAPTIATCAALIDERGGGATATDEAPKAKQAAQPALRFAVALNATKPGRKAPFFIVAGMFGNVLNLRHLALQMEDRAVFGLQARGLIGDEAPHDTIETAAADYIAEMRVIQPEGPYLIGGFSGGGITAYEIARQLQAQGQEVAVLAMLDTPLPVRPGLKRIDKLLMKQQDIRRKGPRYIVEWAVQRWQWEMSKRSQTQTDAIEGSFNNRQIEMAFRGAVAQYQLQPWDGPLTLFRPPLDRHWKVSGGNWVSQEREYVFNDNDWSGWASGLQVIEVPGDHDSMVLTPNVRALAKHLNRLVREADHAHLRPDGAVTRTAAE